MRKGENIVRNKTLELQPCSHRVIIPLYIPSEEGYYEDAFKIFKMCLLSVQKTAISPLKISVISNGSTAIVNEKLYKLYEDNYIDELIIETETIGKINSILKALRTAEERLITITDADVLFLNDWEKEVIVTFEAFPKAGMVSPVPIYRTQLRHTGNIWMDYLFSNKLKFSPVKNPEGLTKFAKSVGWPDLEPHLKDVIATLEGKNKIKAVVGNSHFVGTYKKEVFDKIPLTNSNYKLGGTSEYLYNDLPILKMGGYQLATCDNYAYHMGNVLEQWIEKEFENLKTVHKQYNNFQTIKTLKASPIKYIVSEKIFKKLFKYKGFKQWIYKQKGLTKDQIYNFLERDFLGENN